MKTVFIVNPTAGKGKKLKQLEAHLQELVKTNQGDVDRYYTKAVGDATRFVREYCEKNGAARFIACGGDGTFSEVVNGVLDYKEAEVGVVPVGSGNDFCRNFPVETDFHNVALQVSSDWMPCDVIRYTTKVEGKVITGVCTNMFNIGFDCNVADKTNALKEKTVFGGSFAYVISIFWNLIQKKCTNLRIALDGVKQHDGKLLLTSIANGSYCGGGIKSNPLSSVTDGKINVNIIKNVSRLRFLSLLPSYMKGTHMKRKGIERILKCYSCHRMSITPASGTVRLCIDGEIITAGETRFDVIPGGIRLVVPGCFKKSGGFQTPVCETVGL